MNHERLELDQNVAFQRREWLVQRIGWVAWIVVMLAGLAGLLGPGPLSSDEASSSDGRLSIAYDRFANLHQPTTLEVTMQPEDENDDKLRLRLSQSLLESVRIERIEPEPTSFELSPEGAWYEFRCEPGAATARATIRFEHDQIGSGSAHIQLAGSDNVNINYFVYP